MRYRFKCEYDGQPYAGWQVQPGQVTVQSALEEAFFKILRQEVKVYGSGRTDSGVHARGQVVQFDFEGELDCFKVFKSLNGVLPHSIAVRDLEPCADDFSARFDAKSRYYIYTMQTRKSPLNRERAWQGNHFDIDIEAMKTAASYFVGTHDFIDFCIPRNDDKSTLCEILLFDIKVFDDHLEFHIEGNRFLHRMVRAMVGALVEIGRSRFEPEVIKKALAKEAKAPRIWAPPEGLVLEKVSYEDY